MNEQQRRELISLQIPVHIGDAVYVSWDGYQCKLWTGDGNNQEIYLDDGVQANLIIYFKRINELRRSIHADIAAEAAAEALKDNAP